MLAFDLPKGVSEAPFDDKNILNFIFQIIFWRSRQQVQSSKEKRESCYGFKIPRVTYFLMK